MKSYIAITLALFVGPSCVSSVTYVDSAFPDRKLEEIAVPDQPELVSIDFQFRTNGTYNADVKFMYQGFIESLLRATKVFDIADQNEGSSILDGAPIQQLVIVLDNRADLGYAMQKGAQIGGSFGAVGGFVTDEYMMTV